jgi:CheY-like chemotaxis protein
MEPPVDPRSTILIVEDDAAIREALAEILEEEGYDTQVAAHGRAALDYLRSHQPPSLILLDLMMPVQSGWEFRAEQQRDAALCAIPVVLVSGEPNIAREAAALNASGYFPKPLDVSTLLRVVAQHCAG